MWQRATEPVFTLFVLYRTHILYLQHCTIKESNFVGLMTLNVTVTLVLTTMFLSISTRPGIVRGYLNYPQFYLIK